MTTEIPRIRPDQKVNATRAAALLGIDRHTLTRWRRNGVIRAHKIGTRRYYYTGMDILDAWRGDCAV